MHGVSYRKYKESGREDNFECDVIFATFMYSIKAVSSPASPLLNLKSQNASKKANIFPLMTEPSISFVKVILDF